MAVARAYEQSRGATLYESARGYDNTTSVPETAKK